jgi:hypothetical protein
MVEKPWKSDELSEEEKYKLFLRHYAVYKKEKFNISKQIREEVFGSNSCAEVPTYDPELVAKYVGLVKPMV